MNFSRLLRPVRPSILTRALAVCALAATAALSPPEASAFVEQTPAAVSVRIDGGSQDRVHDTHVDTAGNIYIVGEFNSSTLRIELFGEADSDAPDGNIVELATASQDRLGGGRKLFVAKLDPDGEPVWINTSSGSGSSSATGVVTDEDGTVYITGWFRPGTTIAGTVRNPEFDHEHASSHAVLDQNLFVAAISGGGSWQWFRQLKIGTMGARSVEAGATAVSIDGNLSLSTGNLFPGNSIALDDDGNLYVKGHVASNTLVPGSLPAWASPQPVYVAGLTLEEDGPMDVILSSVFYSPVTGDLLEHETINNPFVAKLGAPAFPNEPGSREWEWIHALYQPGEVVPTPSPELLDDFGASNIPYLGASGDGNVYFAADWTGTLVRDGTSYETSSRNALVVGLSGQSGETSMVAAVASPGNTQVTTIHYEADEEAHYVGGATQGNSDLTFQPGLGTVTAGSGANSAAFIARLGPTAEWSWAETLESGSRLSMTSLRRDPVGSFIVSGSFRADSVDFGEHTVEKHPDVLEAPFLARLGVSGNDRDWSWAVAPNVVPRYFHTFHIFQGHQWEPIAAFHDGGLYIGPAGNLIWIARSGELLDRARNLRTIASIEGVEANFLPPYVLSDRDSDHDNLGGGPDALSGHGALLWSLSLDGEPVDAFSPVGTHIAGQEIPPPSGAWVDGDGRPLEPEIAAPDGSTINQAQHFYWDSYARKLYAVSPVIAEIAWRVSSDLTDEARVTEVASIRWPTPGQGLVTHAGLAGESGDEPAVDLNPPEGGHAFATILFSETDVSQTAEARFAPGAPGHTTFLYYEGDSVAPGNAPARLSVVRTVDWSELITEREVESAVIGLPVDETAFDHDDPAGGNGFVIHPNAPIDGADPDPVHLRETREGPIIPVNTSEPEGVPALDIIWYRPDDIGVGWPSTAVRYEPEWPEDTDHIIIASGLGSELEFSTTVDDETFTSAQPVLTGDAFESPRVYHQPDRSLPGYNPNEEHAVIRPSQQTEEPAVFALRNDLNHMGGYTSEPYVLLKYRDPADDGAWRFRPYRVHVEGGVTAERSFDPPADEPPFIATGATPRYFFDDYTAEAGELIVPPYPLPTVGTCPETDGGGDAFWVDVNGDVWARAAGEMVARHWYPLLDTFYLPGTDPEDLPTCVPWLEYYDEGPSATPPGEAIELRYTVTWPDEVETLRVGDTVTSAKAGLPGVIDWAAGTLIFDENEPALGHVEPEIAATADPLKTAARLMDIVSERSVSLDGVVDGLTLVLADGATLDLDPAPGGYFRIRGLPQSLRERLRLNAQDADDLRLAFRGEEITYVLPSVRLPNILTAPERDGALAVGDGSAAWEDAVERLFLKSRNPNGIDLSGDGEPDDAILSGIVRDDDDNLRFEDLPGNLGLTAGLAQGTGYITLAENNDPDAGGPVSLHIIRVEIPPADGRIFVIPSVNALEERVWVRHAFDFGGDPSHIDFEWYYIFAEEGTPPPPPAHDNPQGDGWIPLADGKGLHEITIGGPGLLTLGNLWVLARTSGYANLSDTGDPFASDWIGQSETSPEPEPLLVQGWIDRVLEGISLFEQRVEDFHSSPVESYVTTIGQAGQRFEGPVALSDDPEFIQQVGLIELYETVLRRGMALSIEASDPATNAAVNNALLRAATRIADLYMLLGNEAYADAQDPTIGFTTSDGEVGALAPALHAFANQQPSLLHEELALLRGRDGRGASVSVAPVYNRLFWNFTGGIEGEPAYVQNYGITDQTGDGFITEEDARALFPQGHGDAWGHYLTALKSHYRLLRHPEFQWVPRSQATTVGGIAIEVDYYDEQKFARAAAARARAGAEIVNLTYRKEYTADPAGQWQGYRDPDRERAWGVDDWARRVGQGAYFDWAVANAVLPENHGTHLNPDLGEVPSGLARIDRDTVDALREIPAAFASVQSRLDESDRGLNPLGIAEGDAIPFDIDPSRVDDGETHFEQVLDRALSAVDNARLLWDHANQLSNRLRRLQVTADDFAREIDEEELHFKNRLIEIYGYPYSGDIGPGRLYPSGYDGPDLYNYLYVDTASVLGSIPAPDSMMTAYFDAMRFGVPEGATGLDEVYAHYFETDAPSVQTYDSADNLLEIDYPLSSREDTGTGWRFQATPDMGTRRAPGEIQVALQSMVELEVELLAALDAHRNHVASIEDALDLLQAQFGLQAQQLELLDKQRGTITTMNKVIAAAYATQATMEYTREVTANVSEAVVEAFPTVVGLASDATSTARSLVLITAAAADAVMGGISVSADITQNTLELAKEKVELTTALEIQKTDFAFEVQQRLKEIEELVRSEVAYRIDIFQKRLELDSALGHVRQAVAEGDRILEKRAAFRRRVAGAVQMNRYQDMTFRIFRNDALRKYRATFDLAARYTYLAAKTYDYETNLAGGDSASGERFLNDIIRQRSIGQFIDGTPLHGSHGLSDPLARMKQNFAVLKGQLGFNNPQVETGRFSLRRELFRIRDASDEAWRDTLERHVVDDLWHVPEFRRYARPFAPEAAGPQPGIVIRFSSDITFGHNFFGRTLAGGDSAYDPSNFSTKIRSLGVWFENYDGTGLSATPRIYVIPVGMDLLRSPRGDTLATREFQILDHRIPIPFPAGGTDLTNPAWIPTVDSLDTALGTHRRYSRFRAYHDGGFDLSEMVANSRLIGRSVWNTEWLIIIPGGTLLADPVQGLETFIGDSDGTGVRDIKIFFQTYAYSGN
ncbi:MAG: hypothetical protein JJU00_11685 [Opitutales bacterium]|nr:hypothetical protein [Opitutales bacterium]